MTSSSGANRKTTQQATESVVWSFSALGILTAVHQRGEHKPTAEPKSIGEYLQFDQAVQNILR